MTIASKEPGVLGEKNIFYDTDICINTLKALEEKVSHSRWVVPVLPEQELESLLSAAIELARTGEDVNNPLCQRFYKDALTLSYTKILTDDAVTTWKYNIQTCVRIMCDKLMELCVLKLDDPTLLNLLSMALNPSNKFHTFNATRTFDGSCSSSVQSTALPLPISEADVYAKSCDNRSPRGWLVNMINIFGRLGGFQKLKERFDVIMGIQRPELTASTSSNETELIIPDVTISDAEEDKPKLHLVEISNNLSDNLEPSASGRTEQPLSLEPTYTSETRVSAVWQLLRPLALCHELLTPNTITTYLLPILECIPDLLDALTDEELKREARCSENKTDAVSCLIRACKCVSTRMPHNHELLKSLEMFRLKMILRLLQMSSFNGKMSALNEINQVITSFTQQPKPEWLTPAVMTDWIRENKVVDIVLRDSLHQPQYVDRLEKLLRFMIKEQSLTRDDLDAIWRAQQGKHEAIVKNVHDLLAKLAWDFTPDQLDHLFVCFKESWPSSSKKQSDKLLEVIRRLAEDDKDGVMANKVLVLFWNLAHSEDVCTEIMDVALANLIKILDFSCSQERDIQKTLWLDNCVEELKSNDKWVIPALKVMREICCLYESGTPSATRTGLTRQQVIERLQGEYTLVILVTNSLTAYMKMVRKQLAEGPIDWFHWLPDGRYPHCTQVHERLSFLRFLLKDGQLWLCPEQAKEIWVCLGEQPAYYADREACFRWFSKLMSDEPDLDPNIVSDFFRINVLTFPPTNLTNTGIRCFERFFKCVNSIEKKIKIKRRSILLLDADLIGLEYLWRVITECSDEIAARGIELLREVSTCVGPEVCASQHYKAFLTQCFERLEQLHRDVDDKDKEIENCNRMCRILHAIQEYINECDKRFSSDRQILPIYRAGRGRHFSVMVRFNFHSGQNKVEDVELYAHSNETLHSLRAEIQKRLKGATDNCAKIDLYINKLELYLGGELLDASQDRRTLFQIPLLRDKSVIIAKVFDNQVCSSGGCGSSNDSSTESSITSSSSPLVPESALPGVLLSQGSWYLPFVLHLEHFGVTNNYILLHDAAHILSQICPAHKLTVDRLGEALLNPDDEPLKQLLYDPEPPTIAYNLEVLYSMVMPTVDLKSEPTRNYQLACVRKSPLLVQCLSDENFMKDAAPHTRRVGFLALVRLTKLVLNTLGILFEMMAADNPDNNIDNAFRFDVNILREAIKVNTNCEYMIKSIAEKLANAFAEQFLNMAEEDMSVSSLLFWQWSTSATVKALYLLAYSVAKEDPITALRHCEDVTLLRECMEVINIAMAMGGGKLETLLNENWWLDTALYLMIDCPSAQVRVSCAEQLLSMCAWDGGGGAREALSALNGVVRSHRIQMHSRNAQQFLQLICRLVAVAGPTPRTREELATEVRWLRVVKEKPHMVDDIMLEGHLHLTKELFQQVPAQVKYEYGAHPDHENGGLIKEVITEMLWPNSWSLRSGCAILPSPPLCRSAGAANAACELLLALVTNCVPNMAALTSLLSQMFYSDKNMPICDWEYMPCIGPRSPAGLVGLKNAGATCYMNSVLQQLYCVPAIRDTLLTVQGAATDPNEDFSGEDLIIESNTDNTTEYNITILKQVQAIFAYLHYSKLQYYVPRGLWAHFRLQGEPVNLREQQDAVEFFMSLLDSLDEALKSLGHEQFMAKTLSGTYSDQKICKGCPHRYCKEEPFSVVSLDIRNMCRLQESLEAYVRGELLEGADAYHCDKCNKKVVTVKRLCLNKLPPVLVIQLKRFEYDFEKVCAIKFNDYFEFPRVLDVEPYTVWGLARAEGDASFNDAGDAQQSPETRYDLSGIVVHSGQASGGHYFSYVLLRDTGNDAGRWVKLDDGEVTECGMHDDEEMKNQCFGGDYMGELYDHLTKRVSYKRQKRWWNAYMLFYTRKDSVDSVGDTLKQMSLKEQLIPKPIRHSVRKSNVAFSHSQEQFSLEHFNFMKKLCCMKPPTGSPTAIWGPEQEEMSMLAVQIATKFLFQVGFRTKKSLRGPASDWYEILCQHLRCSASVRKWFAIDLFRHPQRLCDYLLSCTSAEVRIGFMKIIVFLAHYSMDDPPVANGHGPWCSPEEVTSLSDQLLCCARILADPPPTADPHIIRHLPLLFNLFHAYAALGVNERHQLIKLKILDAVLSICMDDSTSSLVKYQHADSPKIHQLISVLVRCCDVSSRCQQSNKEAPMLPNPYAEPPPPPFVVPTISGHAVDLLYGRAVAYMKKLIEECCICDESINFLQFICWENSNWSRVALSELLWQMTYAYCHELKRHSDMFVAILLLEDSWQHHRIHNALKGVTEERYGLLETAWRARSHYQKRTYACIKLIVTVMSRTPHSVCLLNDTKKRWRNLVDWLHDELDRKYAPSGYTYGTWSPPGASNETSSGYFLERSNSARNVLERAYQLRPEDEEDEEENREGPFIDGDASGEAGDESGDEEDDTTDELRRPLSAPHIISFDAKHPAPSDAERRSLTYVE